jgi:ribosomal protein L32E
MVRNNKPKFIRRGWHKLIRLGSTIKKKRIWRGAKGRHNKIRLERRGQQARPKIGWGEKKSEKGKVEGMKLIRVESLKELAKIKSGEGIIIGSIGEKKRKDIIAIANERKIKILNKYKKGVPN